MHKIYGIGYYDMQDNMTRPGGVFNDTLVSIWTQMTRQQDQTVAAAQVDADKNKQQIKSAVAGRQNCNTYEALKPATYIDDKIVPGYTVMDVSPSGHTSAVEESGVAIFARTGWMDGRSSDGAIARLQALSNPQQVSLGPWGHGTLLSYDPLLNNQPVDESGKLATDIVNFFDECLKQDQRDALGHSINYYTLGEGLWKTTDVWPPDGTKTVKWYPNDQGRLTQDKPKAAVGSDPYQIDFTATTGHADQSLTNLGSPVWGLVPSNLLIDRVRTRSCSAIPARH
jgi:putative CocE/NonD family hydrolase